MSRVKRGTTKLKHRNYTLAKTKGMRFGISTKEKAANEALKHAGNHAFDARRNKKGDFRGLFIIRLNAAVREFGLSYSVFMRKMKEHKSLLNRKMLSELAAREPATFERIIKQVS